jgi:alanine racemase
MIGLVPIGYADGFPVHRPDPHAGEPSAPQRIAVLRGMQPGHQRGSRTEFPRGFVREFVPVIGTVNMDQITVDLTDLDLLTQPDGGVGMVVEIVSPDPQAPNHLPRLASRSGMIPHEMLCRIHSRIPRVYTVDGALEEHADDGRSAQAVEATAAAGIDRRAAVG